MKYDEVWRNTRIIMGKSFELGTVAVFAMNVVKNDDG